MKRILFSFLFSAFALSLWAQPNNATDANGLKQGKWVVNYPNGSKRYEGTFKDGKPVGELHRYHENGKLKAVMTFLEAGMDVPATLYNEKGEKAAEGTFTGQVKSGMWRYFEQGKLRSEEHYTEGLREGQSTVYYPDGKVALTCDWQKNKRHGVSREFYPSGKTRVEMHYELGLRQGWSMAYFENGQPEIEGKYGNDLREGRWKFFTAEGVLRFELNYVNGKLQNPEVMDRIQQKEFAEMEKTRGNLKDPEDFQYDPTGYMRQR